MLTASVAGTIGFGRAPPKAGILNHQTDTSSGPNAPHYEIVIGVRTIPFRRACPFQISVYPQHISLTLDLSQGGFHALKGPVPTSGAFSSISILLLAPNSIGSVTLNTASVWDDPIIDTNFLSDDYDMYLISSGKQII